MCLEVIITFLSGKTIFLCYFSSSTYDIHFKTDFSPEGALYCPVPEDRSFILMSGFISPYTRR